MAPLPLGPRQASLAGLDLADSRGLAYPSLYDEGIGRVGCAVCPLAFGDSGAKLARLELHRERWPWIWRLFEKAVKDWLTTRGARDGIREGQRLADPDLFWENYIRGNPAAGRRPAKGGQGELWQE